MSELFRTPHFLLQCFISQNAEAIVYSSFQVGGHELGSFADRCVQNLLQESVFNTSTKRRLLRLSALMKEKSQFHLNSSQGLCDQQILQLRETIELAEAMEIEIK